MNILIENNKLKSYDEKIEDHITSMLQNVMNYDSCGEDIIDSENCSIVDKKNMEIIDFENSFLSQDNNIDLIDQFNWSNKEKTDKIETETETETEIEIETETETETEIETETETETKSFIEQNLKDPFQLDEFKHVLRNPKKNLSFIKKLDSSYTNDNSFVDDIEKIPSSKTLKSNFFSQSKKKLIQDNYFVPKNFYKNTKNSSFAHNTQDQLISFDLEKEKQNYSNDMSQSLFDKSQFSKRQVNSNYQNQKIFNGQLANGSFSHNNSSYNLNSTNESYRRNSQFLPETYLKDGNTSLSSYKR